MNAKVGVKGWSFFWHPQLALPLTHTQNAQHTQAALIYGMHRIISNQQYQQTLVSLIAFFCLNREQLFLFCSDMYIRSGHLCKSAITADKRGIS